MSRENEGYSFQCITNNVTKSSLINSILSFDKEEGTLKHKLKLKTNAHVLQSKSRHRKQ